jgi:signal peptidase I
MGKQQRDHVIEALSERQREVLRLMADGRSNASIAEAFGISLDGAKWHVREVLTKLGVGSREEAAEIWRTQNGLPARWSRTLKALATAGLGTWGRGAAAAAVVGVASLGATHLVIGSRGVDDAAAQDSIPHLQLLSGENPATAVPGQQAAGGPAVHHYLLDAGSAMEPTLPATGVLKFVLYDLDPARGDIVVFRDPRSTSAVVVKRVVGLPGDFVETRAGQLFINDAEVAEPYIVAEWHGNSPRTLVPAGEYFVMGDARDNSLDSRSRLVGTVPRELILGRVLLPE